MVEEAKRKAAVSSAEIFAAVNPSEGLSYIETMIKRDHPHFFVTSFTSKYHNLPFFYNDVYLLFGDIVTKAHRMLAW